MHEVVYVSFFYTRNGKATIIQLVMAALLFKQ